LNGLKNQKVYKAHYYEFPYYFEPSRNLSLDVQVSFTGVDYELQKYENLVIKSVDPVFQQLSFESGQFKKVSYNPVIMILIIPIFIFLNFNIVMSMFKYSHFSISFNYKFANLNATIAVLVYMLCYKSGEFLMMILVSDMFLHTFGLFITSVSVVFSKNTLALFKKNIPYSLFSLLIAPFAFFFPLFLAYVPLIPLGFWLVDKLLYKDNISPKWISLICAVKALMISFELYFPFYINNTSFSLLMTMDFPRFLTLCVLFPAFFVAICFLSRRRNIKGVYRLSVAPSVKMLHGAEGKHDPKMIGSNFRLEKQFSVLVFGQDIMAQAGLTTSMKVEIYSPFIQMGLLKNNSALDLMVSQRKNRLKNRKGRIFFYGCHLDVKDTNTRPHWGFEVCKHSFAENLKYGIKMSEVKKDGVLSNSKLIWVQYGIKSKCAANNRHHLQSSQQESGQPSDPALRELRPRDLEPLFFLHGPEVLYPAQRPVHLPDVQKSHFSRLQGRDQLPAPSFHRPGPASAV
jgi:hypothetical protein